MKLKYLLGSTLLLLLGMTSCTDYLEREPEAEISATDAYKNFTNFQGFVEELYVLPPDVMKHYWVSSFNWGDDEVITIGNGEYLFGHAVDKGDYRSYIGAGHCYLRRNWTSGADRFSKDIWGSSWYGIRKANMGLQALEQGLMTDASQAERDIIKGQLLFYRAWFYFQLTTYWGGLPYIYEPLDPTSGTFSLPRESYLENAEKMAADFQAAADLLPIDWDDTEIGRRTSGNNALRPNKIWALAYLGKTYLYAASPLMNQGPEGQPYQYNTAMAQKGAEVLGKLLNMIESGQTQYSLVDFSEYTDLFYTNQKNWLMPGGTEAIMRSPTYGADSYWRQANSYQIAPLAEGDGIVLMPAANYVNYFGMVNGRPLDDPQSGFDKTHPWRDRDPRFYKNFVYDGVQVVKGTITTPEDEQYRFAHLYEGGNYYDDARTKSRTGYLLYKFIGIDFNRYDKNYDYAHATHLHLTWLRLAEVYLMYAECLAAMGTPTATAGGFSKNAIEAVNTIRARAGVGDVAPEYQSGQEFMDEVYRERAVELSFEAHRFNDLRRWLLLTRAPYNVKTRQIFDRAPGYEGDNYDIDPKDGEVRNWREEVLITRNLSSKHYWLPFDIDDVTMYPEFYQNPGW